MIKNGSILNRDYEVTKVFCEKYNLSKEKLNFIIHTVVRIHSSYLYDIVVDKNINLVEHSEKFLSFLKTLLELTIKE